ncbi:MAG: metallophosphoesterase [Bacteroidia bacterium]|jgi:predicted MPP superfamily phosphohydrolase|nr:metallophosphoesterase [Bacteroidia bacterium]
MKKIRYLHISDLHIGDKLQTGLLSQTKKVLFEDIKFILSRVEGLDVIFFTGDLVQTGISEEYAQVEEFLSELWELFNSFNYNPYLLCVPGNHDLEREGNVNSPEQKVLTNWINEDIRNDYFWTEPNEYVNFVRKRFNNYSSWYIDTKFRKPEITTGFLPGDFYCSIEVNGLKLGVVGLNSSFLQLINGDFKNRLGIYRNQIQKLFKENYFEWLAKQDISILLTHHSKEWFEPKSLNDYNKEIYCGGTFIDHLSGHMHLPSYINSSQNGFSPQRQFISPSLFGLQYFEEQAKTERIHGYTAGVYALDNDIITRTIWPRISLQTNSGIKITQNEEFNLEKGTSSLTEILSNNTLNNQSQEIGIGLRAGNLFNGDKVSDKVLVRTTFKELNSHKKIRYEVRKSSINNLTKNNFCWLVTSYGLEEHEFISSILSEANINPENCFSLNCDGVSDIDQLIETFKATFSQSITQFFDIINSLDRPLLVFKNIQEILINKSHDLRKFTETIFDFSPNLKIILVSETSPIDDYLNYIKLTPLDTTDIKYYIEDSQELQSSFTIHDYEKIHRISSGIPLIIDKVIEQLKFRPLSDLGEMDFENLTHENVSNTLSKTIVNEIKNLSNDDSKISVRRFKLLSILSLLHNGETFERIRRFDTNSPFHPSDVAFLLNNQLVETVQVNSILGEASPDSEIVKIIKVPRIIRDHVISLFSETEKADVYKNSCSLYLGNNWRNQIKYPHSKEAELDLIIHQNLQIALRFILSYSINNQNEIETVRMCRIALSLIDYFSERGAYKDAISLTEEILLLIKDVSFTDIESIQAQLLRELGESLRMTSIHSKAIPILKSICDDESIALSKKTKNEVRLSIAYAYESKENKEEALRYANQIKKEEKDKDSCVYLSAESVIAQFIEDVEEKNKKLNFIKNKAEKFGYKTLKANMVLDICRNQVNENQLKQLDKIIQESKNNPYTKVRAFVAKARIIFETKDIDKIGEEDLLGLDISYSYSFYQRLSSLLTKCHNLAWRYWSKQNRFDKLLNLFRYSSFVWRLCDETEHEKKYIEDLNSNQEFLDWIDNNGTGVNKIYFEQRASTYR